MLGVVPRLGEVTVVVLDEGILGTVPQLSLHGGVRSLAGSILLDSAFTGVLIFYLANGHGCI